MLNEEQIGAAVNWWANAIANPKFDNGDPSFTGCMCMAMAITLKEGISEEQVEKFKEELKKELGDEAACYRGLNVDYDPDKALCDAMSAAKIPTTNAPWKTNMVFCADGSIKVSYGYGAEYKEILILSKLMKQIEQLIVDIQSDEGLRGSKEFAQVEDRLGDNTEELDELEGMMTDEDVAVYPKLKKQLEFGNW